MNSGDRNAVEVASLPELIDWNHKVHFPRTITTLSQLTIISPVFFTTKMKCSQQVNWTDTTYTMDRTTSLKQAHNVKQIKKVLAPIPASCSRFLTKVLIFGLNSGSYCR